MPKINIYVPTEMLGWLKDHPEVQRSAEFQHRINQLRGGRPVVTEGEREKHRIRRLRVRDGHVALRPGQTPVDYYIKDGDAYVVVVD